MITTDSIRAAFEDIYGAPIDGGIENHPSWDDFEEGFQAALAWQAATEAAKAEQQAGAIDKDLLQATNLAKAIWHRHYRETAPHWQPMETLSGVISQIDNMVCTLVLPPAAKATGTAVELPPLPKAVREKIDMPPKVRTESVVTSAHYTADQMREYGQACAEAARQPAPVVAVKTWQERMFDNAEAGNRIGSPQGFMWQEIADLRAALAVRSQP